MVRAACGLQVRAVMKAAVSCQRRLLCRPPTSLPWGGVNANQFSGRAVVCSWEIQCVGGCMEVVKAVG